jgi:hypothetical protein
MGGQGGRRIRLFLNSPLPADSAMARLASVSPGQCDGNWRGETIASCGDSIAVWLAADKPSPRSTPAKNAA